MTADIPDGWIDGLTRFLQHLPEDARRDRLACSRRNGIWVGRTQGLGVMTPRRRSTTVLSGPMLRATGVAYDVRKDFPYLDYETYDFDVPVGEHGDVYDRYLVRIEEMRQACASSSRRSTRLPEGPINVDDPRVILPPKRKATSEMEAMIHPLQAGDGRAAPAGRRGLRRRSRARRARRATTWSPTARRSRCAGASARRRSSTCRRSRRWCEGAPALRRDRDQREHRHRDGRDRPMSHAALAAPDGHDDHAAYAPVFTGARRCESSTRC